MADVQGRTVQLLIVEDNPGDVRLLQEAFQEVNANVHFHIATDGVQALEMTTRTTNARVKWRPDLILLDLNLPKLSGHDVLKQLKADPQTSFIPVIVFTSSRAESDVRRAYECHANAYLRKPSTLEGLLSAAQDVKNFWMETATLPG
jgi:CheY-like chemotaxis protein